MRIAFLANADNIHTRRWAAFLASRGHELIILCDPPVVNPPHGIQLIHPSMHFVTKVLAFKLFPKPYGNNLYKRFPYHRELKKLRPDIVHGFEALGYGYALAHAGPYPKVLTPWGNDILYDPTRSRIARFLVTTALRKADVITTNYLELAETLEKDYSMPKRKICPFSWGVDLRIFHPGYQGEVKDLMDRLDLPPDAKVILSSRMMKPYWGIDAIARALPKVFEEIPKTYGIFLRGAGDATYENEMKDILRNAGMLGRVRFITEYLSEERMAAFLNLADVFISCPRTDLLSISVLEGLACGCTPILAELDAYKKRVQHTRNGLFFKPGDHQDLSRKLIEFFRHPEWKQAFADFNVALIKEKDDWNKNALVLENIYKELIARYKR